MNTPTKIIVHHDGVSRESESFDIINDYHKTRDFPISSLGFFVGYHYLIERNGAIRQAREDHEEGAHTVGENSSSIGICIVGNGDVEMPTLAQVDSLSVLLDNLCKKHRIADDQIFPHRKYANKTCFGSRLSDDWAIQVLRYRKQALELANHVNSCNALRHSLGQ